MVYVVGLPKEVSDRSVQGNGSNGQANNGAAAHATVLNSLHWKKFKRGGGEWTFLLGPEAVRILDQIEKQARNPAFLIENNLRQSFDPRLIDSMIRTGVLPIRLYKSDDSLTMGSIKTTVRVAQLLGEIIPEI